MIKKDIRYIIKKVIIGILITLGVIFFRPLIANAEEKEQNFSICHVQASDSNVVSGDYCYISGYSGTFYKYLRFNVPNSSIVLNLYYRGDKDSNYLIFYDELNESYIFYRTTSSAKYDFKFHYQNDVYFDGKGPFYVRSYDQYNESLGSSTFSQSYYSSISIFTMKENSLYEEQYKKNSMISGGYSYMNKYNYNVSNNNIYFYTINQSSPLYQDYNENYKDLYNFDWSGYKLISKSMQNFYIDDEKKEIEELDKTPKGYEKIDMFNKYAVLFYPKDFRNIPTECTKTSNTVTTDEDGNVTVVPNSRCDETSYKFNFYYSGYFNTAFSNLKDMSIVSNPVEQLPFPSTSTPYELPLYKNVDEFKGGILFYNDYKSQITDEDGNVTVYYDKGYIWYDTTLYNYLIIDDPNTQVNQDIEYIDENGETQTTNINNIPTKNKTSISSADDTYNFFTNFKTNDHGLSSIITAPLEAIKDLTSSTCNSIDLPIPFSKGQIISLPCMISIYENNFGIIYTMYKTIITGYIGYWICVRIYTLIKGFKDPNDDKIEVLDL